MRYNLFDESRMRGAKNMSVTSNVFKTVGLAFAITNYLKGFFSPFFPSSVYCRAFNTVINRFFAVKIVSDNEC